MNKKTLFYIIYFVSGFLAFCLAAYVYCVKGLKYGTFTCIGILTIFFIINMIRDKKRK